MPPSSSYTPSVFKSPFMFGPACIPFEAVYSICLSNAKGKLWFIKFQFQGSHDSKKKKKKFNNILTTMQPRMFGNSKARKHILHFLEALYRSAVIGIVTPSNCELSVNWNVLRMTHTWNRPYFLHTMWKLKGSLHLHIVRRFNPIVRLSARFMGYLNQSF